MIRRFGQSPRSDQTYRLRPGAYAILPRDQKLLLTRQSAPVVDIQLPGGGIDPGESAIIALHREVYEETGYKISSPRHFGTFRRFVFMPEYDFWAEKICHIFIARPTICMGAPLEPFHTALWMTHDQAISTLGNAGDKHFVERFNCNS